jgi:hypothetical protein
MTTLNEEQAKAYMHKLLGAMSQAGGLRPVHCARLPAQHEGATAACTRADRSKS